MLCTLLATRLLMLKGKWQSLMCFHDLLCNISHIIIATSNQYIVFYFKQFFVNVLMVDLMNSLIIDHYINLILTFTGWPKRITLCRIMTWSLAKLLSVNIESRFSWHNITSAKRAIINVFFLLFLEFCTLDDSESQYSNMWWYVQSAKLLRYYYVWGWCWRVSEGPSGDTAAIKD